MASLRGTQEVWTAHTLTTGDKSALAVPGPGPYVAILIENIGSASATFQIEVAATASQEAGRNALDGTADGGLTWVPYATKDNGTPLTITVAAGASICIDLSPFGPEYVRLHCTAATAGAAVTAFVTSFGPN